MLALLAILAYSQIKSRKLTQRITSVRPGAVALRTEFPPDLIDRRAAASDILLIGLCQQLVFTADDVLDRVDELRDLCADLATTRVALPAR